ncbi:MAG: hypothetical protein ACW98D_04740 [Promethearchaeota archaeon]|jgi:hypothetical protein
MGLGKSFSLSLVALVGLNFIFTLLYFLIDLGQPDAGLDTLMGSIQNTPLFIVFYLFGSVTSLPSTNLNGVIIQPLIPPSNLFFLVRGLGFLIAPLVASILAGKFAESKLQGFAGWLLTTIVSTAAIITIVFVEILLNFTSFQAALLALYGWADFSTILISLLIACIINIIFFGFFALLTSKTEYY